MEKTWKPKVAGIILITIGVGIPLLALIVTFPVYGLFYPSDQYLFTTGPVIILAVWVFPLIGGIFALRKRKWGLALAGSIVSIVVLFPLGVASTVLIALSKDEF